MLTKVGTWTLVATTLAISLGALSVQAQPISSLNPFVQVAVQHVGDFFRGQQGATYVIVVTNGGSAPAGGTPVTVIDSLPLGLTLTSIAGAGWTCDASSASCMRSDALSFFPGQNTYPPITVTVNVSPTAPSTLTNSVSVSAVGIPTSGPATDVVAVGPGTTVPILSAWGLASLAVALCTVGLLFRPRNW